MHIDTSCTLRHLAVFAISLAVLFVAFPVFAETAAGADANHPRKILPKMPNVQQKVELKQNMQEKRALYETATGTMKNPLLKPRMGSTTDEFRKKLQERREQFGGQIKERMKMFFGNMKKRMQAAIGRFEQIIARIETRAEKMEALGANTTEAEAHLKSAKESLDKAEALLTATNDSEIDAVVDAETPREKLGGLKEKVRTVHQHIKNAHESVRAAVAALKAAAAKAGLERGVSPAVTNASSTASTTNEE